MRESIDDIFHLVAQKLPFNAILPCYVYEDSIVIKLPQDINLVLLYICSRPLDRYAAPNGLCILDVDYKTAAFPFVGTCLNAQRQEKTHNNQSTCDYRFHIYFTDERRGLV